MDIRYRKLVRDLNDKDVDLRALAAMTLMKLDFPDAETRNSVREALVDASQDENIAVRFFSRKAVDRIDKHEKNLGALAQPSGTLDEQLASDDVQTVVAALMTIRDSIAKNDTQYANYGKVLKEMLSHDCHSYVRATLISVLKYFLPPEETSILSPYLSDPDSRVKANTIEAIEYLQVADSIPKLFHMLNDPDNRVKAVAAKALQSFEDEKVYGVLEKMLESQEEWMKASAVYSLSRIVSGEAITMLIQTVADSSANLEIRLRALQGLGNYYDSFVYAFARSFIQKPASTKDEQLLRETALKLMRRLEERTGTPPEDTIMTQEQIQNLKNSGEKIGAETTFSTVTKFFAKNKEAASSGEQVNAGALEKENLKKLQNELASFYNDVGTLAFDLYQSGTLDNNGLISIGHEILQVNYSIEQFHARQAEAKQQKASLGFLDSIKNWFSSKVAESGHSHENTQSAFFAKRRLQLMEKLGRETMQKYEDGIYSHEKFEDSFQKYQTLKEQLERAKCLAEAVKQSESPADTKK